MLRRYQDALDEKSHRQLAILLAELSARAYGMLPKYRQRPPEDDEQIAGIRI
jgi:hypothetical protein